MPARMAMIAITTSNSMRVKAAERPFGSIELGSWAAVGFGRLMIEWIGNTQDYTEIYKNLSEFSEEYNIKVEVDASKFTQNDANVFNNLHAILSQTDIGDWEYGNIVFKIRNKKVISSSTMKNPEFDKKLLKIE